MENAQKFIYLQRGFGVRSRIFAIAFRAAPDELFGVVGYEYDANDCVELGYWLRECCWRMGIMSKAAAALVPYAMTKTDIAMFYSGYHSNSPNSGRILRRLGFLQTREEMNFYLHSKRKCL